MWVTVSGNKTLVADNCVGKGGPGPESDKPNLVLMATGPVLPHQILPVMSFQMYLLSISTLTCDGESLYKSASSSWVRCLQSLTETVIGWASKS